MHSRERKPVVLSTVPYYLPGFKGGGKLVTVRNLVAALSSQFHFKVMTADRDLGDAKCYEAVAINRWVTGSDCEIFYARESLTSLPAMCAELQRTHHDILHLNTIFSRRFGMIPLILRRFGLISRKPTVIAPRGELAPAALAVKAGRKQSFLAMARKFGLFDEVMWQASGEEEARDIDNVIGRGAHILIAPDVLSEDYRSWQPSRYRKRAAQLDILFLSRITPVKNLHLAIEALGQLTGEITFRVAGPIDDSSYWARCRMLIATLGANIRTEYAGPVATSDLPNWFGRHGLFFLPTASESFGFVILEAMLAGCPVLISDQTRWRDLQQNGVGWDLPLSRPDLMRERLQQCIAMDAAAHRCMSDRARELALDYIARDDSAARNAALFHSVLTAHRESLAAA
jgi:glycosyltransferase involved in cell wall biosynthesis